VSREQKKSEKKQPHLQENSPNTLAKPAWKSMA